MAMARVETINNVPTIVDNYGIALNSSNSEVHVPQKAITLFEAYPNLENGQIEENTLPAFSYRAVLGTLPDMSSQETGSSEVKKVNEEIYNYHMKGTQGIYTDNMYIGDSEQYVAFYTDENESEDKNKKKLAIRVNDIDIIGGDEDLVKGSLVTQIENVIETAGDINAAIEIRPEYVRLFKGVTPEGAEKPKLQSYVNLTADRIEFFNTDVETEFAHTWVNATSLNSDDLYFSNAYPRYEAAKRPNEENGTGNLIIYARENGHLTIKNIR